VTAAAVPVQAPVWHSQGLKFRLDIPFQVFICVIPAMALVLAGKPRIGAMWLYAALVPMLAFHFFRRNPVSYGAVLLGVMPVLMVLRGVFIYNSVEVLMIGGAIAWLEAGGPDAKALRSPQILILMSLSTIYWLSSWALTGDYVANLRALELSLGAVNLYLLARHRSYLATALLSMLLSITAFGIAIAPYVNSESFRLGTGKIDGERLGNPISFGLPAALILLLTVTDDGRWLLVRKRPLLRGLAAVVCTVLLLLSTSRGSWLVVITGAAILFWWDPRRRAAILIACLAIAVVGIALTSWGHDNTLSHYLDKTFSADQTWSKRTTGRNVMWEAIPRLLGDSPVWGFGPGSGLRTARIYYNENLIWHSLYLQFAAETGLAGLSLVVFLMAIATYQCYRRFRVTGELAPLVGMIGFWCVGVSVPGLDAAAACFLGFGLIGADYTHLYWVRRAPAPAAARVPVPELSGPMVAAGS
jgi:O-antigen ligase